MKNQFSRVTGVAYGKRVTFWTIQGGLRMTKTSKRLYFTADKKGCRRLFLRVLAGLCVLKYVPMLCFGVGFQKKPALPP